MKIKTLILLSLFSLMSCNGGDGGDSGAELNSLLYGGTWNREWEWCPGNNCTGGITYLDEELTFSNNLASFRSFLRGTNTPFGWRLDSYTSELEHRLRSERDDHFKIHLCRHGNDVEIL